MIGQLVIAVAIVVHGAMTGRGRLAEVVREAPGALWHATRAVKKKSEPADTGHQIGL